MDAGVADRERWRQSAENMQVLWFSFFPPLSFGLVGQIKVILLHLIIVLQAHPFQFPGPWAEEGVGGGCGKRGELGCQTGVITEFVPSDSRVYSCLQRRTSCRSSNRSAEGFSTHGKRPRSFFKATPEGSTCLLMRFRRPTLYFCFLVFLFLTPFGFSAIFPNSILQWRGLKTNIYSNKCWEKVKQQHSWPCVCPGFQPPAKFEVFFKNGTKNRRWPQRLNTWLWVESQTWQHQSPLWHHKWLISRSVSISKDTSWEMNKVKW